MCVSTLPQKLSSFLSFFLFLKDFGTSHCADYLIHDFVLFTCSPEYVCRSLRNCHHGTFKLNKKKFGVEKSNYVFTWWKALCCSLVHRMHWNCANFLLYRWKFRTTTFKFLHYLQDQALGYCDYASGFNSLSSLQNFGRKVENMQQLSSARVFFYSPTTCCIYNASGNFKVEFSKNIKLGNNLPSMKQMSIK